MAISNLFADSLFARMLGANSARDNLLVSMTGVKLGDRLLVLGLADPHLLCVLGAKVGLTGRACGVDSSADAVLRTGRQAEKAGVLVELHQSGYEDLPFDEDSFDLAVIRTGSDLTEDTPIKTALGGARRVLRDGGRCLILADLPVSGVQALWNRRRTPLAPGRPVQLLISRNYVGARVLAEREGLLFAEGVSRRLP